MSLEDMIKHYFYVNGNTDENIKELLKTVSKIFNEYIKNREENAKWKI